MKKQIIFIIALFSVVSIQVSAQKVRIAAAANLKYLLEEIKSQYQKEHPKVKIEFTFGPMGTLSQQILNGAAYDFFMAADTDYPQMLKEKKATVGPIVTYAFGRLGMWSKTMDLSKGLNSVLLPEVKKIAVGNNTVGAVYGIRTIDVLKKQGLYDRAIKKIVWGENIIQVAQFAMTGNAELGFISRSIAVSPEFKGKGFYHEIPEDICPPIAQACVLIKGWEHNGEAARFMKYILSKQCDAVWLANGYTIPAKKG